MSNRGLNIQHRTPDFLLKLYVENMQDKSQSHIFISRIKDKEMAAKLAVEQMEHWDIDQCL
jgi:hypothetical protein